MANSDPQRWMRVAIEQAKAAQTAGEVPIGAVVVRDNEVIAMGRNSMEGACDATRHAEIIAIQEAGRKLQNWRLDRCALFVTLEPCPMCIGAILLSRMSELYFGAYDPRQGAVGSVFDLSNHRALPHQVTVYPELLADECSSLLEGFFSGLRRENRGNT